MNVNLESQFNEPIDELSISVEDYLALVKSLRLQEPALHCLKQLKTEVLQALKYLLDTIPILI